MALDWLHIAKELQSVAQAGLTYCDNYFDIDRYKQIQALSNRIYAEYSGFTSEQVEGLFAGNEGYQTPKVDVRGVIFRNNKILMVQEKLDEKWTLPGGWADIGYTPFENTIKEVREEAGMNVKALRLLTVFDKIKHPHPPDAFHIYKLFILCSDSGEEPAAGSETKAVGWFSRNNLPPLSLPRITESQIATMFEYLDDANKPLLCD